MRESVFKIFTAFFLMLAICKVGVGQEVDAGNKKKYEEGLNQFQEFLRAGDLQQGIILLDSLIQQYPNYAEAYYAKSLMYAQGGEMETATSLAEKVVELAPKDFTYNNHLLNLYKGAGNSESVLRTLDNLLKYYPKNTVIYREKIFALYSAGENEKALKVFDEASNVLGESDSLDVVKAEVLIGMEKLQEAQPILEKWYERKSRLKEVYGSLGYIYNKSGQQKRAVSIVEEGLGLTQNDLLYFDLADIYTANGNPKAAYSALLSAFKSEDINFVEKHRVMSQVVMSPQQLMSPNQRLELANTLLRQYPRVPDVYVFKADVSWTNGEPEEAKTLYLTSLGMNPRQPDVWRKLINVGLAIGNYKEAIAHGNEGLAHFPGHVQLSYFTGIAYFMDNDTDKAREYLESALNYSEPENNYVKSMIYGSLGDLYHKLDMVKVSDAAYEEAIKLDSANVTALNNLAYYLSLRKERLDEAAKFALKANEMQPGSSTFQDTYAWVLFQKGDYQEAQRWIEKAVRSESASPLLIEHYGDILSKLGKVKEAVKQWQKALNLSNNQESVSDVQKVKQKISEKRYID